MKDKTRIHIVPQSHIDVVWLWRYDPETIHRCCKPTFTQAIENLDRFPEYTFAQSQVPLYEPMERVYPGVFDKIKKYIHEGRWEIVGGMYVEPEGGEPCGESLVRQCVMGKRYFQQTFGVDVRTGWQPDAWSHPWQLPQIFKKSGIDSFLFRRGDMGEKLFWWESPDGSRVLTFRFDDPEDPPFPGWQETARTFKDRYGVNDTMIVIGWGDHGGGPKADDIQATLKFAKETASEASVEFSTFDRYSKAVLDREPDLPVIDRELGFQLQGDLTNVQEIKKSNRECENILLSSEKWASIASQFLNADYPSGEFEEAWKKLLFNQFHDILGGSLIPPAIEDAMGFYRSVRESCTSIMDMALTTIAKNIDTQGEGLPIVVFNPLSWTRTDFVEVELRYEKDPEHLRLRDSDGHDIPIQLLATHKEKKTTRLRFLFVASQVPSLGYKTYYAVPTSTAHESNTSLTVKDNSLENEFFRVEIDPQTGCVSRLFDKRNMREALNSSQRGNLPIAIEDEGDSEGRFMVGSDSYGKPPGPESQIVSDPSISIIETGPVRVAIRIEKQYQQSRFIQDIRLYTGIPRVDFQLTVDWHDIHRMIKLAFPMALETPEVTYDAPYATAVRPADGLEYPAQMWVDLFANGYGVSLLNNGRYGHDVQDNVVRMSILRSPTEPAYNTDEGIHILDYSLYPHQGAWQNAEVKRRGYELNIPLMAVAEAVHEGRLERDHSFFEVQPDNVTLEVIKQAYDTNEVVFRFYEMHGESCTARLTCPVPFRAAKETDLLEKELQSLQISGNTLEFPITAHEIKTIKAKI
ncbi:MAG: glycoside hydrolase family 38 C-terminal domain-containing protein [bacterium]